VVGITAQLYTVPVSGNARLVARRRARCPATAPADEASIRLCRVQPSFSTPTHEECRMRSREYADKRNEGESPYGWRKYVASQELFLRFCCHTIARDLLTQPVDGYGVVR